MSFENNLAFYHPSSLVVLAYQQLSNSSILASIDSISSIGSIDSIVSIASIDSIANIILCFIKAWCNFFIIVVVVVVVVTLHGIAWARL